MGAVRVGTVLLVVVVVTAIDILVTATMVVSGHLFPASNEAPQAGRAPLDGTLQRLLERNAGLVVHVVDENGKRRGRVGVTVRTVRDTDYEGYSTRWGDDGEVHFYFLGRGTFSVEADGAKAGEVTLALHEEVVCTLSPSGLKIDPR